MYRKLAALLLISAFIFASCTRRSDEKSGEQPVQPDSAVRIENAEKPQRTLTFGDDSPGSGENPGEQATEVIKNPEPVNRTLPFSERVGTERHVPQDRIIGTLQVLPAEDRDSRQIHRLVGKWLSFLQEGETLTDLEDIYAGEVRDFASRREAFFPELKNPVEEVRYGRIRFEDGTARMDIRLFSEKGRASGELVFTFQQGEWRILAEDIVLGDLEEEYQFPDYSAVYELYGTFEM